MTVRPATPDDVAAIDALMDGRAAADGRPALSEHKALRMGRPEVVELLAVDGDRLCGYGQGAHHRRSASDGRGVWEAELVVDPDLDPTAAAAVGRRLIDALRERIGSPVSVWAWRTGDLAAVREAGLNRHRTLLEMRRPLPVAVEASLPHEVSMRTFVPGSDDEAFISANNRAFAGHPENAAMDAEDLALRMDQPWFDPAGLLLAERDGALVGYCWTKVHGGGEGEIYIIGIVPEAQGIGLGRFLVVAGLRDLAGRAGATDALLYTDGDDARAVGLYESLGFRTAFINEVWTSGTQPGS